jgi:hypothetical protein
VGLRAGLDVKIQPRSLGCLATRSIPTGLSVEYRRINSNRLLWKLKAPKPRRDTTKKEREEKSDGVL